MFFDKTCTIYETTYQKVWWTSKRVKSSIYENIECNFEVKRIMIKDTELGRNTDESKYVVVVPITYNKIRENYNVELIDPDLWSRWTYIINDVQADRSMGWWIDCITFIAKEIKWQL